MNLKALLFALGSSLLLASVAHAQWQTTTYTLKGGWNAIYLHGDATHATPDVLFASNPNVLEVWRWNPNPTGMQFTTDSQSPTTGTPDWSVWYRSDPDDASTLSSLTGQTSYLIKVSGGASSSINVQITHRPLPPATRWVRSGANLLGFPAFKSGLASPTISNYFATFTAAIAADSKIFKYVGGELGASNPMQVFSPSFERLDRNQAYWFEAEVVENFYGPFEVTPADPAGLSFGSTGSLHVVRIRNRSTEPFTLTIAPVESVAAPAGQEGVAGAVPVTRRIFNSETGLHEDTLIQSSYTEEIGGHEAVEFSFGIDRSAMTGDPGTFYASLLRFTDEGNLMDVLLPVSARVTSMAGLWVGDVEVDRVISTVAGSPGDSTLRPFPLRYLLHVDDDGTARILSQVFVGLLAALPNNVGVSTVESALKADAKASAMRMTAAHMPLDRVLETGSGNVELGGTLIRIIHLPFNDDVNPFVHQYHPDHDNKDARFQPLPEAAAEAPTVNREVSFEFLATPPPASTALGWGSTVLGGNYTETVTGIHRQPLTVTGSFTFRRVNEIGSITLP